jgi:hypothetical protein
MTRAISVTVMAHGQQLEVHGLAAALIVLIAVLAAHINHLTVGRVVGHVANGKVHLELSESLPSVRLEE